MVSYTFLGNPPPNVQEWIKNHYGPKLDDPLCFTAVDAGATIAFNKYGSPNAASIVYAIESSGQRAALDWQPYTFNTKITLANVGDKVYFRATDENDISFYKSNTSWYGFTTTVGKKIAASGNIQTLMKSDGSKLDISGKSYCYTYMFYNCTSLTTAPSLPATTLADYCYLQMFSACKSLTSAPALPATTLAEYCYYDMFSNCTSLTSAPALPATTLAEYCYENMFFNCPNVIEITFVNLTCEYVVEHALEWGLGIDANYHKFLVVAYCSDGVVVINDVSQSSDAAEPTLVKYVGDEDWTEIMIKGKLTASAIPDIYAVEQIKIGEGVTAIGADAFRADQQQCNISTIEFPSSLKKIGNTAFMGNTALNELAFPNNLKTISDYAFTDCTGIGYGGETSINIPDSVTTIGVQAFQSCSMENVHIGTGIESIGWGAFNYCDSLTSVVFSGKTMSEIQNMDNYPWGIEDTSIIHGS